MMGGLRARADGGGDLVWATPRRRVVLLGAYTPAQVFDVLRTRLPLLGDGLSQKRYSGACLIADFASSLKRAVVVLVRLPHWTDTGREHHPFTEPQLRFGYRGSEIDFRCRPFAGCHAREFTTRSLT